MRIAMGWMLLLVVLGLARTPGGHAVDLREAYVVTPENASRVEVTAARVLIEEAAKRTDITWPEVHGWPASGMPIVLCTQSSAGAAGRPLPQTPVPAGPEGYTLAALGDAVWIIGGGPEGVLYGVGHFLRLLEWAPGKARLPGPTVVTSTPRFPIRGHQLGYRNTANSYDAWTIGQYEQYIRELSFFGVNAIENIPFQQEDSPLMPVSRHEMNQALSRICADYGMQYWVWTPATVDLDDAVKRAALLEEHTALFDACEHLSAVFFPGGDPGNNHPRAVMPFLAEVAKRLAPRHPEARVWMSLQGFGPREVDYFFRWIETNRPSWFGGVVGGPSSPPLEELRSRLPESYALRDYPDITHAVRCQHPASWLDPAIAFTSGREGSNPEPRRYAGILRKVDEYTDGFITYSDGVHDDVNKVVYSALGWNPDTDVRDVLVQYARVFLAPAAAEKAADGLLALEQNWRGPLAGNGGVEAALALWQSLGDGALSPNWRWDFAQLKAHYDAYIRARLIHEEALEEEANAVLAGAAAWGSEDAMRTARIILAQAETNPPRPELRQTIEVLCRRLYKHIGYQSSVAKYQASNPERSAVLDYLDYPLNNRWWYEDQFAAIAQLTSEEARVTRLRILAQWENPGPGSYYDDIGNVAQSPHVLRGEPLETDPLQRRSPNPDFMWWDAGMHAYRQSWVSKMDWPIGLRYEQLDPQANYIVRTTGYGQCLLRIDGERVFPIQSGKDIGAINTFPVPRAALQDRQITLTFDRPNEPGINWRYTSRLSEVWLIRE